MRNTHYDSETGLTLPREIQLQRIRRVVSRELSEKQQLYFSAYYFDNLSPAQIARRYGIHRSTVLRTLRRADARLRRYLTY